MKRRIIAIVLAAALIFSVLGFMACDPIEIDLGKLFGGKDEPTAAPEKPTVAPVTEAPATDAPETEEPAPATGVTFVNGLDCTVEELYISTSDSSYWGDPVADGIAAGGELHIDFEDLEGEGSGSAYDIDVYDENDVDYDAYGIVLTDGDVLKITGDGSVGTLEITHADGTADEYPMEVYGAGTPTELRYVHPYIENMYDGKSVGDSIYNSFSFRKVRLYGDDAKSFPALAAALEEANGDRYDDEYDYFLDMVDSSEELDPGENDYLINTYICEAFVRRADTNVLSVLYENEITYNNGKHWDYRSDNFDPITGARIAFTDVVTDISSFASIVNEELARVGEDDYTLDTEIDYSSYLTDPDCDDFCFTIDHDGVTVIFNSNAFDNYEIYPSMVLIPFADHPEIFNDKYFSAMGDYTCAFPWGMHSFFSIGGSIRSIMVSGSQDDAGNFTSLSAYCDDEIFRDSDTWFFSIYPMLVHSGGKDYLYVNISFEDDYTSLRILEIKNGKVRDVGTTNSTFGYLWENPDAPDGGNYLEECIVDPSGYNLSSRTDLLSTRDGVRHYHTASDGLPMPEGDVYELLAPIRLVLKSSLKVYTVGSDGHDTGDTITLEPGTAMTYIATDNVSQSLFVLGDGTLVHVYSDYDPDGYTATIDGVSIFDIFEELFFAG